MSSLVNKTNVGHKVTWLKRGLLAVASSFLLITVGCEPQVPLVSSEDEATVDIQGAAFENMTMIEIQAKTTDNRDPDDPTRVENKSFSLNLADEDTPEGLTSYKVDIADCASGYSASNVELLSSPTEGSGYKNIELYEGDTGCTIITSQFTIEGEVFDCGDSSGDADAEVVNCDEDNDAAPSAQTYGQRITVTNNHSDLSVRVNDDSTLEFLLSSLSVTHDQDDFVDAEVEHVIETIYIDQVSLMGIWSLQHKELLFIDADDPSDAGESRAKGFFRFILRCESGYEDDQDDDGNGKSCGSNQYHDLSIALSKTSQGTHDEIGVVESGTYNGKDSDLLASDNDESTIQIVTSAQNVAVDWNRLNPSDEDGDSTYYSNVFAGLAGDLIVDIYCDRCIYGGAIEKIYLTLYDRAGDENEATLYNEWSMKDDSLSNPSTASDPHDGAYAD